MMKTNLDVVKEKIANMSVEEIARYINLALEDCNFGIEQWSKRTVEVS